MFCRKYFFKIHFNVPIDRYRCLVSLDGQRSLGVLEQIFTTPDSKPEPPPPREYTSQSTRRFRNFRRND